MTYSFKIKLYNKKSIKCNLNVFWDDNIVNYLKFLALYNLSYGKINDFRESIINIWNKDKLIIDNLNLE